MKEWVIETIWIGIAVAFFFAMITHLRVWSIARDSRRIADALESFATNNHPRATNGTNEVHDYLE